METKSIDTLHQIERDVLLSIADILKCNYSNIDPTFWTKTVTSAICNLSSKHSSQYYASGIDDIHGEWLWDITWSKEAPKPYKNHAKINFQGLLLICEIEWWGPNQIFSDFQKLLVGIADYKIFITEYFSGNFAKNWDSIVNNCRQSLELIQPDGSNYLLIALPYEENFDKSGKDPLYGIKWRSWKH